MSPESCLHTELTCFHDSVGTPISSMLGLAQLASALPLVWFFIRRVAARKDREAIVSSTSLQGEREYNHNVNVSQN